MEALLYPISLGELESWRRELGVTQDEARKRFVQLVILESIGDSRLRNEITFKGGNALRFLYQSPRSTKDLDFTADAGFPDTEAEIRELLDPVLARGARRAGIRLRCQRVKRNPARADAMLPTYEISVAFQFPTDRHFVDFDSWNRPLNEIVPLEISLNDVVCESSEGKLSPDKEIAVRVCAFARWRTLLRKSCGPSCSSQSAIAIVGKMSTTSHERYASMAASSIARRSQRSFRRSHRRARLMRDGARLTMTCGHVLHLNTGISSQSMIRSSYPLTRRGRKSCALFVS